ncbi:unnamed protein product [Schistocephalus solidus]|uniref:Uncharacterized protein n=1 Tax=Schistocephalus solidus TaxID=70667 RepID=A0A183TCT3_SCHSO|nr:unnamed protein product [Schistocephalus solidus]
MLSLSKRIHSSHGPARSPPHPRKRHPPRCQHILRTHQRFSYSSYELNYQYLQQSPSPQTQHIPTYLNLIVTAHAHHASAWSVTCESVAQRPANQCQEHQHTPTAPDSTVRITQAHSHTTWAYKVACVSCSRTPPAIL